MATFEKIKEKVRKLTKSFSTTQLSEDSLKEYVNTFYLYDFPQIVQTSDLFRNLSFSTTPNVDSYSTTDGNFIFNLKDFKDFVIMTDQPVYLSGRQIKIYQDPNDFYNQFSQVKSLGSIGTGDGVTTNFTYNLPTTVLHNSVLIGTLNAAGEALIAHDVPDTDAYGREGNTGELRDNGDNNIGTINYLTGAIDITFGAAPADGEDITYEIFAFTATMPTGILFFDNTFTLRPVPDKVYEVKLQVRVQPTEFDNNADTPLIKEWWQFIAYGAAKKVLEDRSDLETVNSIMPEFERQKLFVMRKTHLNKSKDRTSTIFTGAANLTAPWNYDGWFYYG